MRATLDWDDEEIMREFLPRINAAAAESDPQRSLTSFEEGRTTRNPWELRRSANGGYHYVEWGAASTWGRAVELRDDYGDDPKRIRLDLVRRQRGSPFLQVLYRRKYMERFGFEPESGRPGELVEGVKHVPDDERIRDPESRELDYPRTLRLLLDEHVTAEEISRRTKLKSYRDSRGGRSASTIRGYLRKPGRLSRLPSGHPVKRVIRRLARSRGIGHFQGDESLDEDRVEYFDESEKDERRTFVEYVDVPWAETNDQLAKNAAASGDSEERLLNIHTGTWNRNIGDVQLKRFIHDAIADYVVHDVLSPSGHGDLPSLSLDRDKANLSTAFSREPDSLNFERELLDPDETEHYLDGMIDRTDEIVLDGEIVDPRRFALFEVILWDEDFSDLLWHVIGAWTGESVDDATILRDTKGWW